MDPIIISITNFIRGRNQFSPSFLFFSSFGDTMSPPGSARTSVKEF